MEVPPFWKKIGKMHIQLLGGLIVALYQVKDIFSVGPLSIKCLITGLKFVEYFGTILVVIIFISSKDGHFSSIGTNLQFWYVD